MANQTIRRTALAALLLASMHGADALAQSGMRQPSTASAHLTGLAEPNASAAKPCVLLRNDNVLFGQAQQVGEYVVIRDGLGGEVQLPRKEVACWGPSVRDLYRYRVDHRTRNDLATRLKDARWCFRYDLFDLADQELAVIRQHAPNNAEAASIKTQIARARSPQPGNAQLTGVPPSEAAGSVHLVDHQDSAPPNIEIDQPTLRFFAGNVQPTLINRCGNCHGHDSQRPWSLIVPGSRTRPSSRMTRENLTASLEFVDAADPENSPLLQKAITPHGGSATPLDPRHAKSLEALKMWISVTAQMKSAQATTSTPVDDAAGQMTPELTALESIAPEWDAPEIAAIESGAPIRQPLGDTIGHADAYLAERPSVAEHPSMANRTPLPSVAVRNDAVQKDAGPSTSATTGPARLPRVSDPFSPDLFNRRHHGPQ